MIFSVLALFSCTLFPIITINTLSSSSPICPLICYNKLNYNVKSTVSEGRVTTMRVGIYNHQHLRGGCPGCSQIYVRGMISDAVKCKNRIEGIFGMDCEFFNYTDLGDYPPQHLNRPSFIRMMDDVESGKLDVIIVISLSKISDNIDLVLAIYKKCKDNNVKLISHEKGLETLEILDKALKAREDNSLITFGE